MLVYHYYDEFTSLAAGPPVVEPNLITGVGRGKFRPFPKMERYHKHKKKTARMMAKQSRRRNHKRK